MPHQGRNVKRFREMLGIKQDALAFELGDDWNQQKVSLLEQKETIEPAILERVSAVLNIPVEAFQNFDEEQVVNIISNNTFDNCAQPVAGTANYQDCTFNPLDKLIEAYEEIKLLNAALLKEKDNQIAMLERMLNKK